MSLCLLQLPRFLLQQQQQQAHCAMLHKHTFTLCVCVSGCEYYTCVCLSLLTPHLSPSIIYSLCCLLCTACTCICVCVCDKNFSCCILAFKVLPLLLRGRGLLFPFPSLCQISFAWLGHTFSRQMLCVCVACVIWAPKTAASSSEFSWFFSQL